MAVLRRWRKPAGEVLHARPTAYPPERHVPCILVAIETYIESRKPKAVAAEHAWPFFCATINEWLPEPDDARVVLWSDRLAAERVGDEASPPVEALG